MSDNKDFNNNSEYSTVTLSLDDGTELECAIIRTFPAGDKNYIALLPIADIDEEESEVYLYRFSLDSNNELCYSSQYQIHSQVYPVLYQGRHS